MNLTEYAKMELEAAGLFSEDSDYGGMLGESALELVEVFANQGHSGFSAAMMANICDKLFRYKPLTQLTGDDSEWTKLDYCEDMKFQNRRAGSVFKGDDGAYQSDYYVFREPDGCSFTSSLSRKSVEFPYTPKHVTIEVRKNATDAEKAEAIAAYEESQAGVA